jgi:hypothetical protein
MCLEAKALGTPAKFRTDSRDGAEECPGTFLSPPREAVRGIMKLQRSMEYVVKRGC